MLLKRNIGHAAPSSLNPASNTVLAAMKDSIPSCEHVILRHSRGGNHTGTSLSSEITSLLIAKNITSKNISDIDPVEQGIISLNESEKSLIDIVKSVLKINERKTVVRIAGGWVRDKLLGRDSHDVDLALDDSTGTQFAELIKNYLDENKTIEAGKVHVIPANPDQSKHLETATFHVAGLDVDLVNLRKEVYENTDSRIPSSMAFGTANEDAFRRDFTMNALFYNINTGRLEDLTGKGVDDLRNGLVRTPLPSRETFSDDPLRMLRAIRFASRFGFRLDADLCSGLADKENAIHLATKVSKERIGVELQGAFCSPYPSLGFDILVSHGLSEATFKVGDYFAGKKSPYEVTQIYSNGLLTSTIFWDLLCENEFLPGAKLLFNSASTDKDVRTAAMVASFLFSISSQKIINPKGKPEGVLWVVALQSLKFSTSIAQNAESIALGARLFLPFFSLEASGEIEKLIRASESDGDAVYEPSDNYFLKYDEGAMASASSEPNIMTIIPPNLSIAEKKVCYQRIILGRIICQVKSLWGLSLHLTTASVSSTPVSKVYKRFASDLEDKIVNKWHLNRFVDEELPIKGGDLMGTLGIKGKQVGYVIKVARDYYLMNGLDTPKATCIEWLKDWWKNNSSSAPQ